MDATTLIGKIVKFPVNTLHGKGKQAGTVTRVMPSGKIEIRAQLGGYYVVDPSELIA
jgi:hypothetical protein